jgi:hypothetical protein
LPAAHHDLHETNVSCNTRSPLTEKERRATRRNATMTKDRPQIPHTVQRYYQHTRLHWRHDLPDVASGARFDAAGGGGSGRSSREADVRMAPAEIVDQPQRSLSTLTMCWLSECSVVSATRQPAEQAVR